MKDDLTLAYEAERGTTKTEAAVSHVDDLFDKYVGRVDPGNSNDVETNLADLLADLRHWAKDNGVDYDSADGTAAMHVDHEVDDDDDEDDEDDDDTEQED